MIRASDEFPSFFEPRQSEPLIIDCGANIGVSVLEWKTRWPMSRIICFEPDPDAFRLLSLNMERNDIPGVQCIHAAVADFDGAGVDGGVLVVAVAVLRRVADGLEAGLDQVAL